MADGSYFKTLHPPANKFNNIYNILYILLEISLHISIQGNGGVKKLPSATTATPSGVGIGDVPKKNTLVFNVHFLRVVLAEGESLEDIHVDVLEILRFVSLRSE